MNNKNQEMTNKLVSMLSKPVAYNKTCVVCGDVFAVNTKDSDLEKCIACQIKEDLKIGDDVIINMNVLNLWKAKKYDKTKGIDPILCAVAEGIMLLPEEVENRNHLSVISLSKNKLNNDNIESRIRQLMKKSNGKYDALLFIRFNAKDDFSAFRVRLSDRLIKKLEGKSTLFVKKYIMALVVKNTLKNIKKGNKRK